MSPNEQQMTTSEAVRVVLRIRPLNPRERLSSAESCLQTMDGARVAIMETTPKQFHFDALQCDETLEGMDSQDAIYESVGMSDLIEAFVQGFNCSVLAYGQTGSGKTHTMGTHNPESRGLIPRAIDDILASCQGNADLYVTFIEVYNEELYDLLDERRAKRVTIREDQSGCILLTGVSEERIPISDPDVRHRIQSLLNRGSLARTTKSTALNMASSRSHAILTITLRQETASGTFLCSKMHFVDLAGSERLKRTGVEGERAKESISINGGLLALGNVIAALSSEPRAKHIPYRDSRLTRLLQDALGGNARTVMVACVSPAQADLPETLNTLRYAQRARHIQNQARRNEEQQGAEVEVLQLRRQVASLKAELLELRSGESGEVGQMRLELAELKRRLRDHGLSDSPRKHGHSYKRSLILRDPTTIRFTELVDSLCQQISAVNVNEDSGPDWQTSIRSDIKYLQTAYEETALDLQRALNKSSSIERQYEERLALMQRTLDQTQKERDEALNRCKAKTVAEPANRGMKSSNAAYEERIRTLGRELVETRKKLAELQQQATRHSSPKENIQEMRQVLQNVRAEKQHLVQKIGELENSASKQEVDYVEQLRELKARERQATESANKWKKACEFQRVLLAKKSESIRVTTARLDGLLGLLRRRQVTVPSPTIGRVLHSPGWKHVLKSHFHAPQHEESIPVNPFQPPEKRPSPGTPPVKMQKARRITPPQ